MKAVLLSHPFAKPDAQGVAAGLCAAGILGGFYTGIAAQPGSLAATGIEWISRWAPCAANRLVPGVDQSRIRSLAVLEVAVRMGAKLAHWTGLRRLNEGDVVGWVHDAAVALLPWPRDTDCVYAYEDAALRTFRRANRKDVARVYDLPTPHYLTVERVWRSEAVRWPGAMGSKPHVEPKWKKDRKDAELAEATHISAASRFTRQSVDAIGCKTPVHVTPYGFPVHAFRCKPCIPEGPFTAIAVGNHNLGKGTPYLLEAWKRAGIKDSRLRLIGRMGLTEKFIEPYRGLFEHVPYVPRIRLAAEYQAADVLVFPALCDGFGMVIQESMCCGTPVITTRCCGGVECMDHDREGWIIPERNVDALAEQLRAVAADRNRAFAMGKAARLRAERYDWKDAGEAFAAFLAEV